ncbi:succinate dehydrogenase/Fumarate reductase transmembrane subunit, partial [Chlamydia psittaci 08-2626_L3]
KVGCRHIFTF